MSILPQAVDPQVRVVCCFVCLVFVFRGMVRQGMERSHISPFRFGAFFFFFFFRFSMSSPVKNHNEVFNSRYSFFSIPALTIDSLRLNSSIVFISPIFFFFFAFSRFRYLALQSIFVVAVAFFVRFNDG